MYELFEEIFWEVGEENNLTAWWEIYDSEIYDTVCERIAERMGISEEELGEREDFREWDSEMAEEL